jgi:hypothetical protein
VSDSGSLGDSRLWNNYATHSGSWHDVGAGALRACRNIGCREHGRLAFSCRLAGGAVSGRDSGGLCNSRLWNGYAAHCDSRHNMCAGASRAGRNIRCRIHSRLTFGCRLTRAVGGSDSGRLCNGGRWNGDAAYSRRWHDMRSGASRAGGDVGGSQYGTDPRGGCHYRCA